MTTKDFVDSMDGPVEIRIPDLHMSTIQKQIDGRQLVNPIEVSATTLITPVGNIDAIIIPAQMLAPVIDAAMRSRIGFGPSDALRVWRIAKLLWTAGKGLWDAVRNRK